MFCRCTISIICSLICLFMCPCGFSSFSYNSFAFTKLIALLHSICLFKNSSCTIAEPELSRGDTVYLVGLRSLKAISRKSTVTNPCLSLHVSSSDPPCYRATNMEVIELDSGKRVDLNGPNFVGLYAIHADLTLCYIPDFGNAFTGVLSNEHGKVQAIWASFSSSAKVLTVYSVLIVFFYMLQLQSLFSAKIWWQSSIC